MKCVGVIKLFSRVYGIRQIKEMLYPSIFAFYQSNVLYFYSIESIGNRAVKSHKSFQIAEIFRKL